MSAIQRAVEIVGTQEKLAAAVGVTQGRVSHWVGGGTIPTKYFPLIHKATGCQVTPEELLAEQMQKAANNG